jgi:hypothetical protein
MLDTRGAGDSGAAYNDNGSQYGGGQYGGGDTGGRTTQAAPRQAAARVDEMEDEIPF